MTSSTGVDTSTPGVTITYSGGEGAVVTLTAGGAEIDDYSKAAPNISKSSDGHTESYALRGTMQYKFHATAGNWVESEASGQLTLTNHLVDGNQQPDSTTFASAVSGTYSCSGSTLTLVENFGGGPLTFIFTKAGAALAEPSPVQRANSIIINGLERTYLLYVPPSLDLKQPAPLVVALTGCSGSAAFMEAITNFDSQARTGKFIVVYPEPVGGAGCWEADTSQATTIGPDLPFLSQLLDRLMTKYRIDKSRIYAAGFSGGGMLAHALACEMSDRFAAVASVAGVLFPKLTCQPARPVSILEMHGTADNNVPYLGQPPDMPSTATTIQFWVTENGCPGPPTQTVSGITTTSIWVGCRGGTVVRLDTVKGGHHQWFGSGLDPVPGEPNSTAEIWQFFSNLVPSA